MNQVKFLKKRWVRRHLEAGLIPGFHSKRARQRVQFPQDEVRDRIQARHKRGRKVTKYEAGKL